MSRARTSNPPSAASASSAEATTGRAGRNRQRQRLIDACISALHIHGPSRTTVAKVVALAGLSPGIVRFYFDSKAAMLVASLEYLAAEFEQRVLLPVSQLRHSPVQALELLVELYIDPQIASPRKVSVWYSFWGEASSRQEYYDICGRKDDDFAALVRELIERLIAQSGAAHLDADGIALGLIGVLEILWQTFAFQSESSIDRAAARRRSLAYLRSVFPGQFGPAAVAPREAAAPDRANGEAVALPTPMPMAMPTPVPAPGVRLPAWAYAHAALLAAERDRLLRPAWQFIGHDAEVPASGDFLSADLAGERVLVVRDERGRLRAFRNACRRRPHALVIARNGRFDGAIHCASHSLTYRLDGRLVDGDTPGDLALLELKQLGRLILVRASGAGAAQQYAVDPEFDWSDFDRMQPAGAQQIEVAADWKLIVERWLEAPVPQRQFLAPNQLLEVRRDAALILQVIPVAAGRCRIQRLDYLAVAATAAAAQRARDPKRRDAQARSALAGWQRQVDAWLQREIALAESTQTGLAGAADELDDSAPIGAPLAQFRQSITALLPAIPTLPGRVL